MWQHVVVATAARGGWWWRRRGSAGAAAAAAAAVPPEPRNRGNVAAAPFSASAEALSLSLYALEKESPWQPPAALGRFGCRCCQTQTLHNTAALFSVCVCVFISSFFFTFVLLR